MFYSLRPDGQFDDFSLHGACPVITGKRQRDRGGCCRLLLRILLLPCPSASTLWCRERISFSLTPFQVSSNAEPLLVASARESMGVRCVQPF